MSKLGIGSVQFGLQYGLNSKSAPRDSEIDDILQIARSNGIDLIDTASGYGDAEVVLGRNNQLDSFNIVSKYSSLSKDVFETVDSSLKKLRKDSLYGYLIHNFCDYQTNKKLWKDLQRIRLLGKVEHIGFSLYSTAELEELLYDNLDFDILQIPYNILDREFEPYLPILKEKCVEIHARSVFLQGLLLRDLNQIPDYLNPLYKYVKEIDTYSKQQGISRTSIALNFVVSNKYIDKVVLGVHCPEQLLSNMQSLSEDFLSDFNIDISKDELFLLKPKNWKK